MTFTEAIIVSLLSGFASSIVSLIFSFKQFSSKKWWEKKSDEYLRVIQELVSFQNCAYKWQDYYWDELSHESKKKLTDSEIIELVKENKKLKESIRIAAMTGSILISRKATEELEKLLKTISEFDEIGPDDPIDAIGKEYEAIKQTVNNIRNIAKNDLGVEN